MLGGVHGTPTDKEKIQVIHRLSTGRLTRYAILGERRGAEPKAERR